MDFKRILTALVGFPLVAILLIFGNKYVVDIAFSIVAIMCLNEYFKSFKDDNKNLRWIAYIDAIAISIMHIVKEEYIFEIFVGIVPLSLLILFAIVIATEMKYTVKDVAIVLLGICYIIIFLAFIPLIRQMENGIIKIWIPFIAAWGTDIFAYLIGKHFGKHKFSSVSPKKSVEGCIAGVVGTIIIAAIFTYISNKYFGMNFDYLYIIIISAVLSLVGQLGDFAASSIKRYSDVKDFGNILPGHGGLLDRIDSLIFIAPFAYFMLMMV